jgi:hypothetical protein
MSIEFQPWPKVARLNRDIVITEKIDGTNAAIGVQVCAIPACDGQDQGHTCPGPLVYAQSRTRIITPADDNFGFARWVADNADTLASFLGPGLHFGEWWGEGIQRGYGIKGKRFSLFNVARWGFINSPEYGDVAPCDVVPTLYEGPFAVPFSLDDPTPSPAEWALSKLRHEGSVAVPGFMQPEGIVIYHTAAKTMFKVTIHGDEKPKGSTE